MFVSVLVVPRETSVIQIEINAELYLAPGLGEWTIGDNGKLDKKVKKAHDRPVPVQNNELDAELSHYDREQKDLPERISDNRNARVLFPADELPEIAIVKTGCSGILATEQLSKCN